MNLLSVVSTNYKNIQSGYSSLN